MFRDCSFHRLSSVLGDNKAEAGDLFLRLSLVLLLQFVIMPATLLLVTCCYFCIILSREEHSLALWC